MAPGGAPERRLRTGAGSARRVHACRLAHVLGSTDDRARTTASPSHDGPSARRPVRRPAGGPHTHPRTALGARRHSRIHARGIRSAPLPAHLTLRRPPSPHPLPPDPPRAPWATAPSPRSTRCRWPGPSGSRGRSLPCVRTACTGERHTRVSAPLPQIGAAPGRVGAGAGHPGVADGPLGGRGRRRGGARRARLGRARRRAARAGLRGPRGRGPASADRGPVGQRPYGTAALDRRLTRRRGAARTGSGSCSSTAGTAPGAMARGAGRRAACLYGPASRHHASGRQRPRTDAGVRPVPERRAEAAGRAARSARLRGVAHPARGVGRGWSAQRSAAAGRRPASGAGDLDAPPSSTLRLRPAAAARERTEPGPPLARLVVVVDDLDALLSPALGSPGRPAAGSVVRALEAVARDGERLGVHLVAAAGVEGRTAESELARAAALRVMLDAVPSARAGRTRARAGAALGPDGRVTPFQAGPGHGSHPPYGHPAPHGRPPGVAPHG